MICIDIVLATVGFFVLQYIRLLVGNVVVGSRHMTNEITILCVNQASMQKQKDLLIN